MRNPWSVAILPCLLAAHDAPATFAREAAPWARGLVAAAEYAPSLQGGVWSAPNRAQGLRLTWVADGLVVEERSSGAPLAKLTTAAVGRAGARRALGSAEPSGTPRVERRWEGVSEWWENRPEGVEHGWTLTRRPAGDGALRLTLEVQCARVEVRGATALLTPPRERS